MKERTQVRNHTPAVILAVEARATSLSAGHDLPEVNSNTYYIYRIYHHLSNISPFILSITIYCEYIITYFEYITIYYEYITFQHEER